VKRITTSGSVASVTVQVSDSCLHNFWYNIGIEADMVRTLNPRFHCYFHLTNLVKSGVKGSAIYDSAVSGIILTVD